MANFVFLGGDMRTIASHAYLIEQGYDALILTTDTNENATVGDYLNFARSADVLILPAPLTRDGIYIRGTPGVDVSAVFSSLSPGTLVFSGALPLPYRRMGIKQVNYSEDEKYICEMAYITAEGTLGHILSDYGYVLRDARIVLIGWGRIAKRLYDMIIHFTKNIDIILRREEEIKKLRADGVTADNFSALENACAYADIIINTVPSLVVNRDVISEMKPNAHLIDLASKPGGIDFNAAFEAGIEAVHLLALPGKCAPISAGIALGKCIIENYEKYGGKL